MNCRGTKKQRTGGGWGEGELQKVDCPELVMSEVLAMPVFCLNLSSKGTMAIPLPASPPLPPPPGPYKSTFVSTIDSRCCEEQRVVVVVRLSTVTKEQHGVWNVAGMLHVQLVSADAMSS